MKTMSARIDIAAPPARVWAVPGIISGEHRFTLTESYDGTTLVQSESFGGLLAWTATKTMAKTEAAFRDLNEAIKQRAEAELVQ